MIIERKTNLVDSIAQIVKMVQTNVENYTKIAVVRTVNDDDTYNVEVVSADFDLNKPDENNYMYSVHNVTHKKINTDSYVYMTAINRRVYVIFAALDQNDVDIKSTDTIKMDGQTITFKAEKELKITDKDDNLLLDITPDAVNITADTIGLTGSNGGKIEVTDKVNLSNQVASLKDILSDLVTTLTTNVVPDCTLVPPYGSGTGSVLASDLIQLSVKINGLLK
jgi:hypothetical protein